MTPTARTLEALRARGFVTEVVERWIPRANIRKDCFGVADILAAHPLDRVILLVQATSTSNVSARVAKAKGRAMVLRKWLLAGGRFQVWGWGLVQGRWRLKVVELRGEDLEGVVLEQPRRRLNNRHKQGDLFDGKGVKA